MQCKDIQLHCSSSYNLLPYPTASHYLISYLIPLQWPTWHVTHRCVCCCCLKATIIKKDSFLTALHVLYKKLVYNLFLRQWKVCKQMCQKRQPINNISYQKKNICRLCNKIWRNKISYQAVLLNVTITSDETLKVFLLPHNEMNCIRANVINTRNIISIVACCERKWFP